MTDSLQAQAALDKLLPTTPTASEPSEPSPLLRLPLEIRRQIYQHVLKCHERHQAKAVRQIRELEKNPNHYYFTRH